MLRLLRLCEDTVILITADQHTVAGQGRTAHSYTRQHVSAELGEPDPFTRALWFHGTRTATGNTFPAGLLTLNHSESLAMKMLLDQAPNDVVRKRLQEWDAPGGPGRDVSAPN